MAGCARSQMGSKSAPGRRGLRRRELDWFGGRWLRWLRWLSWWDVDFASVQVFAQLLEKNWIEARKISKSSWQALARSRKGGLNRPIRGPIEELCLGARLGTPCWGGDARMSFRLRVRTQRIRQRLHPQGVQVGNCSFPLCNIQFLSHNLSPANIRSTPSPGATLGIHLYQSNMGLQRKRNRNGDGLFDFDPHPHPSPRIPILSLSSIVYPIMMHDARCVYAMC